MIGSIERPYRDIYLQTVALLPVAVRAHVSPFVCRAVVCLFTLHGNTKTYKSKASYGMINKLPYAAYCQNSTIIHSVSNLLHHHHHHHHHCLNDAPKIRSSPLLSPSILLNSPPVPASPCLLPSKTPASPIGKYETSGIPFSPRCKAWT